MITEPVFLVRFVVIPDGMLGAPWTLTVPREATEGERRVLLDRDETVDWIRRNPDATADELAGWIERIGEWFGE